jgi:hypothetical protein
MELADLLQLMSRVSRLIELWKTKNVGLQM